MGKNAPALSNFNAGELSPDLAGRVDNEKYGVGCDTLQNFIPRVQGPGRRRPGFRYVTAVKDSTQRTWLRKFIFSQSQSYQIEFGVGYIRFYSNHGQVQASSPPTYNNAVTYTPGQYVLYPSPIGVTYVCIATTVGNTPPNATYWYPLPSGAYEIPSPYTSGMLTNSDGTCGLHIEQSGDVLYIACGSWWPMTLTRYGATKWVLAYYSPPDGPFNEGNSANSPALYATKVAGSNTQYTVKSTASMFDPSDAAGYSGTGTPGRLIRIDAQTFNIPPWTTNVAYTLGTYARYNGNTYLCITAGTSGTAPPVQTYGVQWDGKGGAQWLYVDSGYGIGQVTGYTNSTTVTVTVTAQVGGVSGTAGAQNYNFPSSVIGTATTITAITQANPCVVTVTSATGWAIGDPVYLTGVGGMTQISEQMYIITAISGTNVTLGSVDSTGYSAFTSGGTAIRNASLSWELGAWGPNQNAFGFTSQFPTTLAFYDDRLFWAGGINWWGSAPGQYLSHTEDLYGQVTAACAVSGIIAAQEVDAITWLSPANILLMGTKGGEFGLSPITYTSPLAPDNVQVVRQSKWRSRQIRAELIGTSNFYVQASGKKVMAQDYNFYLDRYDSTNQTRLANHIAGYTVASGIIDIAWHQEPYECLWAVRSDGILIGYTFDRPDNVTGWHEHPLGPSLAGAAVCECVSVIPAPDGTRDEVWAIVNRTIGGTTVRSVEYMEKDLETGDAQTSACYLDMSAVYSGVATTTITGLGYLNGETVSVLRDGGGHPDCVVSGGQIALAYPGSTVQVGLACPANLVTMDVEGGADVGTAQGKIKRAVMATVRLKNTLGGYIGMSGGSLDLIQPNVSTTNLGSPPPLTTGDVLVSIPGDFSGRCKIQVQQSQPFPMEIVGLFPIIDIKEPSPP